MQDIRKRMHFLCTEIFLFKITNINMKSLIIKQVALKKFKDYINSCLYNKDLD